MRLAISGWVLLAACAAGQPRTDASGRPEWVSLGSRLTMAGADRTLVGVGIATARHSGARRSQADVRARAQVAKLIESLLETAERSVRQQSPAAPREPGAIEETPARYTISSPTTVVDHWDDGGTTYARAEAKLQDVVGAVETFRDEDAGGARPIAPAVRAWFKAHAIELFDEQLGAERRHMENERAREQRPRALR